MSLIDITKQANRGFKENYNAGEYTPNILDLQLAIAVRSRDMASYVAVNGISSPLVCPDLESYNTSRPSNEAFELYNSRLKEVIREFELSKETTEVLDSGRSR
ncbi:MAG: hypothetical protein IKF82_06745 [Bacilli bacterium]|nr:hypothetical protein [Bacilli bacterium]